MSGLGEEVTYDYVFGGPRSAVSYSTLKLTSPPVRLRPDGKFCKWFQICKKQTVQILSKFFFIQKSIQKMRNSDLVEV